MEAKLININDWECFGGGAAGESYYHKTDNRLMLKLYLERHPKEMAEREYLNSRKVFELGVPCPEVYDFVTDGTRYGMTFQRMPEKISLSRAVAEDPSKVDQVAKDFAELGRMLHSIECDTNVFPSQKELYLKDLENPFVSERLKELIRGVLGELSDSTTCLHGDFHFGNAIYSEGKAYLIDLGDFSYGNPDIDISEMFMIAYCASEQNCREQMHMELSLCRQFTDRLIWHYYGLQSEQELGLKKMYLSHIVCLQIAHMSLMHAGPARWPFIEQNLIKMLERA